MKISVIIPNYNTAHYIESAINSVLNNDYQDYEIVVVDDGSSDSSDAVVDKYLKLPNFRYVKQANSGLAAARNTGIEHSHGEYLVFLDSDDIIEPEKLRRQADFLDANPDYGATYSNTICFVENNVDDLIKIKFPHYQGDILSDLVFGNFMHVNTLMVRKSLVLAAGKFDPQFRELEDWDLWLRMSLIGTRFHYDDEILSRVRIRRGSMTNNQDKMYGSMVRVLQKFLNLLQDREEVINRKQVCCNATEAFFIYRLLAKQRKGYVAALWKEAVRLRNPFFFRAVKLTLKYLISPFRRNRNVIIEQFEQVWQNE